MKAQRQFQLHDGKKGAALAIRVTPRMAKNEISEILNDGTIKIRLTAPPVDGKANEALIEFLAKILGINNSKIEIVAGLTGRDKLVTITDMDTETVHAKIINHLA